MGKSTLQEETVPRPSQPEQAGRQELQLRVACIAVMSGRLGETRDRLSFVEACINHFSPVCCWLQRSLAETTSRLSL